MRLLLLIAVIALFVDAFFYSGAYTQAAYKQVAMAADQLVGRVSETVETAPGPESSN